jgi:hypothetical protein
MSSPHVNVAHVGSGQSALRLVSASHAPARGVAVCRHTIWCLCQVIVPASPASQVLAGCPAAVTHGRQHQLVARVLPSTPAARAAQSEQRIAEIQSSLDNKINTLPPSQRQLYHDLQVSAVWHALDRSHIPQMSPGQHGRGSLAIPRSLCHSNLHDIWLQRAGTTAATQHTMSSSRCGARTNTPGASSEAATTA